MPELRLDGPPGWIAFHSRDGLSIMAATGAPQTPPLLPEPRIRYSSWSPDGEWLAVSVPPGWILPGGDNWKTEIFIVRRDGSGLTQVTHDDKSNDHPSWSPDGQWIAYSSSHATDEDQDGHIFKVRRDGSQDIQLTFDGEYDDADPAWSPLSDRIAFRRGYLDALCFVPAGGGEVECPEVETGYGLRNITAVHIAWSPGGEWLAFNSWETVGSLPNTIYKARPDGSDLTLLADGSIPSWSPDGEWIAFASREDWQGESLRQSTIWVMRRDGSQRSLISTGAWAPSWSPSTHYPDMPTMPGGWIVYSRLRNPININNNDIYVVRDDGWNAQRLTTDEADNLRPSWSPDGQWIAFDSDREGMREVYVMRRDGSEIRKLTSSSFVDDEGFDRANDSPAWSPDGQWIAFGDADDEIHIIAPDGSQESVITENALDPNSLFWSPDGQWIAFEQGYGRGIFVVPKHGVSVQSYMRWFPHSIEDGSNGSWSPDGQWIAFERRGQGYNQVDIYIARPDGTDETRLTQTPEWAHDPCWSPDGQWMAFGCNEGICAMRADGTGRMVLKREDYYVSGLSWSSR